MTTRALIVGCNYPEDSNPLTGVTDACNIHALLAETFGVEHENCILLVDDGELCTEDNAPTADVIKASLTTLVEQSTAGDSLLFYFAGHGTQVPCEDAEEGDGADEALVTTDLNLITDDDLREVLIALPDGVKFTMISDSCHSGTLLDQEVLASVEGPSEIEGASVDGLDAIVAEGLAAASGGGRCIDLCQMLTERCGIHVTPANVRCALVALHGERCPAKYRSLWDWVSNITVGDVVDTMSGFFSEPENQEREEVQKLQSALTHLQEERGSDARFSVNWDAVSGVTGVASLLWDVFSATPADPNVRCALLALDNNTSLAGDRSLWDWAKQITVGDVVDTVSSFFAEPENQEREDLEDVRCCLDHLQQERGGDERFWPAVGAVTGVVSLIHNVFSATPGAAEQVRCLCPMPGSKPEDCLPPGKAILLTGCRSDQYSADTGYGGLFTNSLLATIAAYQEANPEVPITNRTLMWCVCSALGQLGAEQTPCLECMEEEADAPFLLPGCVGVCA